MRKFWHVDGIDEGFASLGKAQRMAEKKYHNVELRWRGPYRNGSGEEIMVGRTDDNRSIVIWYEF